MKKPTLLLLLCLLLASCSDDKEQQPPLVTNVTISDSDKVFNPGDAVTVTADGFLDGDQLMLDIRWPLPDEPIQEGYSRGTQAIITERTAKSLTFLAPGGYPQSTVEIFLNRASKLMPLGKISVSDGQRPEVQQLYGITNSRTRADYPHGIERVKLGIEGEITSVVTFEEGEDFLNIVTEPGAWSLCGMRKRNDQSSVDFFDLSIQHWGNTGINDHTVALCSGNSLVAVNRWDEKSVILSAVSRPSLTRMNTPPAARPYTLPEGLKPEALSCFPGVYVTDGHLLLSADNGDGTFSPVVISMQETSIRLLDPIKADALIPIRIPVRNKLNPDTYTMTGGYILSKPNEGETEFRLWDTTTHSLGAPFTTYPNAALSAATFISVVSKELTERKLYVLFEGYRSGNLIKVLDLQTNEWENSSDGGFPYSEIALAK